MFIRGGFCRKGRYGVTFGTLRHGEDASSAKSSGGARDLAYRMKRLMVDDKLQDVTFSVGEERQTFRANSYVLAAASEVFYGMFFSNFERESVVKVPDGTPEAFKTLLEYIHTDEASLTLENVSEVLYIAKKYKVDGLCAKVTSFVRTNLDVSNVFDFLAALKVCLDYIDENTEAVLKSDAFLGIDASQLNAILSRDSLRGPEVVIWQRATDWAKERLQRRDEEASPEAIRKTLGDLLYLIRFPSMSLEEFGEGPGRSGILTEEERLEIYEWFVIQKAPALFVALPRHLPWDSVGWDASSASKGLADL